MRISNFISLPAILLLFLSACNEKQPGAPAGTSLATLPPALEIAFETVAEEYFFDGVIEAASQSTVSAQTGGRVAELPFDVGDYVPKDAVIVRLRGKEPRARQQQALAAVQEAKAALEEAELYYRRAIPLFEQQMLSQSDMDRVRTNYEKSKARFEAAKAAAIEAEAQLDYTTIRAPYAGVVTERHVEVGVTVYPGTKLMTGFALENLRVVVDIPQQQIDALRTHRRARVIFPNGRSLDTESLTVFPYADPQTHTVKVRVNLPDGEQALYPGMLVKIAFVADQQVVLPVPQDSIAQRSEVTGVYVLHDKHLEFRQIRFGDPLPDGRVPVLAGLSSGEAIVPDPEAAAAYLKMQGNISREAETP